MATFDVKTPMQKVIDHMNGEFLGIRTGRAHPGLVGDVKADYYGTPTPLKQMATVSVLDARTLQITPYDQTAVKTIEKAILAANIGVTPVVDGKVIRLSMPELTGERRKELCKYVSKLGEEAKIALRNLRRDANDFYKKAEDAGEISEDQLKTELDVVQKETDSFVSKVDELVKEKEKEVMENI
ncbi:MULTISPECIES: ribosome recycling factor [Jonquetella]|uniref:Ribosome-recycling factor n=1 Tax=Jonquetella anthropi DSM 22815 TaxID=885272 RepID=H0UK43_9BACT|nr:MULTISPECIES: ribosome recycling factor [Jonquetella]EEX48614.1 ribosome recycling factor [Jonquetella anthropi E3_33 E1]EHM13052.1 ribosome recycling factor [Jonquetella anthropi DSM 22815]ERL23826.1 ribosome recycling factor [Jonquetella sp. BV3C21]